jgi:hypothetical protein
MTLLDRVCAVLNLDFSRVEFRSPLSVDECEARLKDRTIWNLSAQGTDDRSPVVGDISREDFFLYPRPNSRNLFQVCLAGQMTEAGSGTRLEGRFTIFLLGKVFIFLWFGVGGWYAAGYFRAALTALVSGSGQMRDGGSAWLGLAVLPAGLALGLGAVRMGRMKAAEEKRQLGQFLAQAIKARQILDGGLASG